MPAPVLELVSLAPAPQREALVQEVEAVGQAPANVCACRNIARIPDTSMRASTTVPSKADCLGAEAVGAVAPADLLHAKAE